jgi:hypothetical protein
LPPPLRVTSPPPSSTTSGLVLRTLAVAVMVMVTGAEPQRNPITPPWATACTTADDVQLAAVPLPTQRVGVVPTAAAPAGTAARPPDQPACPSAEPGVAPALADPLGLADAFVDPTVAATLACADPLGVERAPAWADDSTEALVEVPDDGVEAATVGLTTPPEPHATVDATVARVTATADSARNARLGINTR